MEGLGDGFRRVVDYCSRVGDHDYYKEAVGHAMDTLVCSSPLGRNHNGNSHHPDDTTPVVGIGYLNDNDPVWVGSCCPRDADRRTKASPHPGTILLLRAIVTWLDM